MASLVHDYTTQAGRRICVIDYAVPEQMAKALYEYFHHYTEWSFDANEEGAGDNVQFLCHLDNNWVEQSPLWELLRKYVKKFYGEGYIPYNCSVNHTRYGDNPMDHRDTYDPDVKDVTLLLYLNPHWNMNFAGETVYIDERGEIELSVLPKFCRLAIHEGYINHLSRAPARIATNSRYTLAIKATPNKEYLVDRVKDDMGSSIKEVVYRKSALEEQIFGCARNEVEKLI